MRQLFFVFVALLCSVATAGVRRWEDHTRSRVLDPATSAALFVGVREFPYDNTLAQVPYAVDDAVDLAYEVAIEGKPVLVDAERVVLALSGEPQKPESIEKLRTLLSAGASRQRAGQSDILTLLESQSRAVGANGILIVAFATHGMSEDGTQYLLTASSLLAHRETFLTDAKICDVVSRNDVPRSLIFLDACRERLSRDRRGGDPDPRSIAALWHSMRGVNGQAVITAAAAGGYAYDDDARRNGVFTEAVIDGLRCGATTNSEGFITVDTLYSYVSAHVLTWLQEHKDPATKRATQLRCENGTKQMPLSICVSRTASASPHRAR